MSSSAPTIELPIERHRLDNGLRVVLHHDPALPLVAINLWYHVGSKNERPGSTGLAHLFEHMLFQGSSNVGTNDHFRHVQQVGGVLNGSTWYDRTNYYETLPTHHLRLGLWLESDRMGHLLAALTAEKLETQREVVTNERRQRVDNQPYGSAMEVLHELLYPPEHPYHWPVIGYMGDIATATLEDVEGFLRRYYIPNNAVLTLAGDFDPPAALREIDTWFGDIPPGPPPEPVAAPLALLAPSRRQVLPDDVQLARVHLGFRGPAFGEPDWYAADLLAGVLTGGRSSPIYDDLVYRRQIARDVGATILPTELAASFVITATGRPGVPAEELEAALVGHLGRAATQALPAEGIERARNRVLTAFYSELQTVDRKADLLSQFATYFDEPERLRDEVGRYLLPTAEDLTAFAAERLGTTGQVTVAVVPRGEDH